MTSSRLRYFLLFCFLTASFISNAQEPDSVFCCKRHEREYYRLHPRRFIPEPVITSKADETPAPSQANEEALTLTEQNDTVVFGAEPGIPATEPNTAVVLKKPGRTVKKPSGQVHRAIVKQVFKSKTKSDPTEEGIKTESRLGFWFTTVGLTLMSLGFFAGLSGMVLLIGFLTLIPGLIFGIRTLRNAPAKWQGYYATILSALGLLAVILLYALVLIFFSIWL